MAATPPSSSLPGGYSGYVGAGGNAAKTAGEEAFAVIQAQLGAPYVWGAQGPASVGFDCAGLVRYCYLQVGIEILQGTAAQWGNNNTLNTIFDVKQAQAQAQAGGTYFPSDPSQTAMSESDLEIGDLLYYGQVGGAAPDQHVMFYTGNGQTIDAPQTGQVVQWAGLYLTLGGLGGTEPFMGVKRIQPPKGWTAPTSINVKGPSTINTSQGTGQGNQPSGNFAATAAQYGPQLKALKDPRSNLPFSAAFQGQTFGSSSGTLRIPTGVRGLPPFNQIRTAAQLVRGGMVELVAQTFRCYFMMNPQTISVSVGITTDNLSPLQQDPSMWQSGGYPITNQTVSFTIYFNRMYEVWRGDPNGPPGPGTEGCRWDIRALERLMGIFDAAIDKGGIVGLGNNGWGEWPATMMPLQVVFGGANSLQFQGVIAGFDYTFTMFDVNMVPIEAYADIQVMRVFLPTSSQPDLVSGLVTKTNAAGPQGLPTTNAFTKGQVLTK